ncbi:MAG TPA: hypothetical protein VGC66_21730 [Pyrinomonadaceae bacterium]|jgi:hypothetical protein
MSTDDEDEPAQENGEAEPDAAQFSDGDLFFEESEELSPEARTQFWMSVTAYEQAPSTTHFQLLAESGIELHAPESLDDERLATKLREVIEGLARLHIFLSQTDHLSDRQLYELLWRDVLREAIKDLPLGATSAWHIDLAGSGSIEDTELYLKYYADEDLRRQWAADFPDDLMPEHEESPFDRDRYLPQAGDRAQTNEEDGEVM